MAFSIRLTEEEKNLAQSYAALHSMSLSEAFKRSLFDKIEEEFDISLADEAYKDYLDSDKNSTPISNLWKELDI